MALRIVAITALAGLTAACGYKGPLYMPPPPNAPAGSAPKPAPVATPAATAVPVVPASGTATLPNDPNSDATPSR